MLKQFILTVETGDLEGDTLTITHLIYEHLSPALQIKDLVPFNGETKPLGKVSAVSELRRLTGINIIDAIDVLESARANGYSDIGDVRINYIANESGQDYIIRRL